MVWNLVTKILKSFPTNSKLVIYTGLFWLGRPKKVACDTEVGLTPEGWYILAQGNALGLKANKNIALNGRDISG